MEFVLELSMTNWIEVVFIFTTFTCSVSFVIALISNLKVRMIDCEKEAKS